VIEPERLSDLERLVADGTAALAERPAPLLGERLACMLGVPPTLAGATAAETAAIVEVLERDGSPQAVEVLAALDRLMASSWARAAGPAAQRLIDAGVAPAASPVELSVVKAFLADVGAFALLCVHVTAGSSHYQATLIAQKTGAGTDHLDGGLASSLTEEQAEERYGALRTSLGEAVVDLDPAGARKEAGKLFAWALELSAPSTEGLELERPLLSLALTGRRDPWPRLSAITEATSRRMREQAGGAPGGGAPAGGAPVGGGAAPPAGLSASLARASKAERAGAKAARAARKRNR